MAKIIMTQKFNSPCIICNCTPVDETQEGRPPLPMFHAEGVNVNWNEDCNICKICAGVMADMLGRDDELTTARLRKELEALQDSHAELTNEHEKLTSQVERLIDGKKAVKEIREKQQETAGQIKKKPKEAKKA